jgi:hypothetical protein
MVSMVGRLLSSFASEPFPAIPGPLSPSARDSASTSLEAKAEGTNYGRGESQKAGFVIYKNRPT